MKDTALPLLNRKLGRPVTISDRKRLVIRMPGGEEIRIVADTANGRFVPRLEAPEGAVISYELVTPS